MAATLEPLDVAHFPTTSPQKPAPDDSRQADAHMESAISHLDTELGDDELDDAARSKEQVLQRQSGARQAVFDAWYLDKAQTTDVTLTPISRSRREDVNAQQTESLREMLQKNEDVRRIIGSERSYQIELFERAKSQNTIAVLDTGSGKTLIAILLLRHVLDEQIQLRALGSPRRITVFLVEKVTLMFQQASVLRANLSYPLAELCGEMGVDLWSREKWTEIVKDHEYIVCTADVLLFCLMRSFIKFEQISLLVFDEAHHAKKGHPYARIMQEFYPRYPAPGQILPRIFGMTASPVDIDGVDAIVEKASQLEETLHSKIATVAFSELAEIVARPLEYEVEYDQIPYDSQHYSVFATSLHQELHAKYWDLHYFKDLFGKSTIIRSTLGPWCSDMYWRHAFSEAAARKRQNKAQKRNGDVDRPLVLPQDDAGATNPVTTVSQELLDQQIRDLEGAADEISNYPVALPLATHQHLSEKVLELHRLLQEYYERETDARCLVFVDEKITARLLHDVFVLIGGSFMKPGFLVGSTQRNIEDVKHTFKDQFATLIKFRNGDLNCLFATSVAEEGLDVPECNLIVRFDPCRTMIQYIQSRGRARARVSRFVHLIPKTDRELALERLKDIRDCEQKMRDFCAHDMQADRLLVGDAIDQEDLDASSEDLKLPVQVDKHTGARVTFFFSMVILNHYVDCVPRDVGEEMSVCYDVTSVGRKFRCEVTFPARAKIPPASGRAYPRKILAKMAAAYQAVKYLKSQHLLDAHFLPVIKQEQHLLRNARLALKAKEKSGYEAQLKPSIWYQGRGLIPQELYLTRIELLGEWDQPTKPLLLLTRCAIPVLPSFPLFRLDNNAVKIKLTQSTACMKIDELSLAQLNWFTLTMFKDIFNKSYEIDPLKMSYWLAPVKDATGGPWKPDHIEIDWKLLHDMYMQTSRQWEPSENPQHLVNRFLIDPYNGGRRYFTKEYRPELVPGDAVPDENLTGVKKGQSIVDYTSSLWARSKSRKTWAQSQPVFKADRIQHRLNVLATASKSEQAFNPDCYVCLEPLRISGLPTPVVRMMLLFPAIIHRIESYLIAIEFVTARNLDIGPELALEALTKDSDNFDEHDEEMINIQHGMGSNYERLEFLGDTFLKMATSISTFLRFPSREEHWMHPERMALLCNKNLMDNAVANGVPRYIRASAFSRRTWYPQGIKLLAGKGANKTDESKVVQKLSGKTIADVCEATIGAAFASHIKTGYEASDRFDEAVRAVTVFVSSEARQAHNMQSWEDYRKVYNVSTWEQETCSAAEVRIAETIHDESHTYRFNRPKLLMSALTHPSLPSSYSNVPSYQRLEFLGDSLLDMTSVWYLFSRHPDKDPSWLTDHKGPMVANKFMGAICAKLGLHRHMRHQSPTLQKQLTTYVAEFNEANEKQGRTLDFWQDLKDPPKFMADLVESYVGAVFIDSDFDYAEIQRFFDTHMAPFFQDMSVYDSFANNHPINKLRERLEIQMGCENWRVMCRELESDDGQSRAILSTVVIHKKTLGFQKASTDRVARFYVAKEASELLEGLTPTDFRAMYGCGCSDETS